MHEVGLMQEVIDIIRSSREAQGIKQVKRIHLVVGKLTAAQPDALQFAFSVLARTEPWLHAAVMEIEERPMVGECGHCQTRSVLADYRSHCPNCGQPGLQLVAGRELYVDYYEGE